MTESGVNLRALRKHNRALLLTEIRRAGGLSRVELAERSGLTAQAVSKIVPELIDAGFLDEERQFDGNVGKPRTQLRIRPGARYALGVQLDRDEVHVVLTDLLGAVLSKTTSKLKLGFSPDDAMSAISDGVDQLTGYLDRAKLLGLCVGALGPLDHHTGVIHDATGLTGWHEVSLRGRLAARTGLTVIVDKDTNTAAFAHQWHADRPPVTTAVVLVGTGIGVGLLVDGKLYRGPRTNAGEFGHTTLSFEGPRCKCGRRGCVEVMHNSASSPEEAARLLGIGLADLVQILDLERIVLAGRSIRATAELYTSTITAQLAEQLPVPHWQRIRVEVSDLGDDLVAIGAAAEVLDAFYADPS